MTSRGVEYTRIEMRNLSMKAVPENAEIRLDLHCDHLTSAHTDFMVGRIDYFIQNLVKRHQDWFITTVKSREREE